MPPLLRFLSPLLVFIFLAAPAFGLPPAEGNSGSSEDRTIRSASEYDYPPFCVKNAENQADGFSVELLRAALNAMGREVSFELGPWSEVKQSLVEGEVEVLPLVGRTPEREEVFDFTFPYLTMHGTIVVRADNSTIRSLADLTGKQVAVMKGDNAEEFLRRSELDLAIATTPTFEVALRNLSAGRYDAVVVQKLTGLQLMAQLGLNNLRTVGPPLTEFVQSFCFAVREGDKELLSVLNEGLSIVIADGTFGHLQARWFGSIEEGQRLRSRILVGGDRNYPPYEFLDENGQPTGFNVELTRALARQLGLDVVIQLGPWAEIREALANNEIDIVQGMFYSPERDQVFDFSPAHSVVTHTFVIREGTRMPQSMAELAGLSILVMRGDIMHDVAVEQGYADQLTLVNSQEEALRLLAEGRHDCALVARTPAHYWVEKNGWTNLRISDRPLRSPEYCYAALHEKDWLLTHFSEGLTSLKASGEYRRIYAKWLGPYEERSLNFWDIAKPLLWLIAGLLILLITALIWSRTLRAKVRERTHALQTEIAERRQSEEALAQSESGLRLALEAGRMGMWDWQLAANRLDWSEGYFRLLGYRPGEVEPTQENYDQRVHPEDLPRRNTAMEQALNEKKDYFCEYRSLWPDGTVHWVEARGRFIFDDQGKPVRMYGVLIDIDEKKAAEEQLIKAKHSAEEASRSKSEFLANMSHEIRTPLNGLFGMLQYLQTTPMNPDQNETVDVALQSGRNLLNILNDILDLSRIEAGKMDLVQETFRPAETLDEVVDIFRASAKTRGIELACDLGARMAETYRGDEGRLRQVLFNLVGNAVKFTESGFVRIKGQAQPLPGNAEKLGLFFSVSDSGVGIPQEKLKDIFAPFTQVDGSYTRRHGGSGLGLSIVQRLIGLMNGEIDIVSAPGQGTKVSFWIEAEPAPQQEPAKNGKTEKSPRRPARPLKILVAEDEQVNRLILERLLTNQGHRVVSVPDGQQYLETLQKEDFDVVFMDVQMPRMDGLEATRQTRSLEGRKSRTPIVALTAHAMRGDREKFLAAGMDAYMSKPVDAETIRQTLAQFA